MNGKQHVADRGEVMDQVELLEDKTNLLAAKGVLLDLVHGCQVLTVNGDRP